MDRDKALNIANDFQNYLLKGDEGYIKKYTKTQIKCALSLISHSNSNRQWYKEMERRVAELDDLAKGNKWDKSYFWNKIFPIILTGVVGFTVGYCLNLLKVRDLKKEIQTFKTKVSIIQSGIKEAIDSKDPSKITAVLNNLNRQK